MVASGLSLVGGVGVVLGLVGSVGCPPWGSILLFTWRHVTYEEFRLPSVWAHFSCCSIHLALDGLAFCLEKK